MTVLYSDSAFGLLQNLDSRQRLLRWKPPKSTLFQVQGLSTVSKLAPGLQLSFKVTTKPDYCLQS